MIVRCLRILMIGSHAALRVDSRQLLPYRITEGLPVIRSQSSEEMRAFGPPLP